MSHTCCERCNRMRLTGDCEGTLRVKPERHHLIQGSDNGSGGLVALSQTGG